MHHFNCLPTLQMYHSLVCQECSYKFHQMFTTSQKNSKHQYTCADWTKCVDTNYSTLYSNNLNHLHLPGRNHKIYYSKKPIHILWLPPACSTTSQHFHPSSQYVQPALAVNISLDVVNLTMVNISLLDFHIWQHLRDHRNETHLHHLSGIPSVPIA